MLLNCKVCDGRVSSDAATCPHCGTPSFHDETDAQRRERIINDVVKNSLKGNCPVCHAGTLCRMNAGSRGAAFGEGNLVGAFTKSVRCNKCGYLA